MIDFFAFQANNSKPNVTNNLAFYFCLQSPADIFCRTFVLIKSVS